MARSQQTILVADDENVVLDFVSLVLRRAGFAVRAADSGEAALRLLEEEGEAPGLAILDVVMPGMSGPQLFTRLQDVYPNLRVLFMSGYSEDEIEVRCGRRLDNLLKKPFAAPQLLDHVRRTLEQPVSLRA